MAFYKPSTLVHGLELNDSAAPLRWNWIIWLFFFISLSFKRKIIGEPALRPLYLPSLVIGCFLLIWIFYRFYRAYGLNWRQPVDALVTAILLLTIGYIFIQSFLYPSSINDVIYITSTVFFIYAYSLLTIGVIGWKKSCADVLDALFLYSLLNLLFVFLNWTNPALTELVMLPIEKTGYGSRIVGLTGDPTSLGALFSIALLLLFAFRAYLKFNSVLLFCAVLILIGLFLSGSRNALLSLGLACLTISAVDTKNMKGLLQLFTCIVLGLLSLVVLAFVVPEVAAKINEVFRVDDPNAFSRFDIWDKAVFHLENLEICQIVFGGGALYVQDIYGSSPYNAFLRLILSHGIVITGFYLLLIALICMRALLDTEVLRRQIILGLLVYWFSFSIFLDTLFAEFFHFSELVLWFAAALTSASTLQRAGWKPRPYESVQETDR